MKTIHVVIAVIVFLAIVWFLKRNSASRALPSSVERQINEDAKFSMSGQGPNMGINP